LNGYARLALAAAAIVLAAVGGLYLLGPGASSIGGPQVTPTPSLTPAPASTSTGTVLLDNDSCTWEDNPRAMLLPSLLSIRIRNESDYLGTFFLEFIRQGHTYEEGVAFVAEIQRRVSTGEDWPPNEVSVSVVDLDLPTGTEGFLQHGPYTPSTPEPSDAQVSAGYGTYAIVCSTNNAANGDVLRVFAVGPLDVVAAP
jgi:hypothetical protein